MPRGEVMQHFFNKENVGLVTARSNKSDSCDHFYITDSITEAKAGERTTQSATFPLYIYTVSKQQTLDGTPERKPNLNPKIVKQIADGLGLKFVPESSYVKTSEDKKSKEIPDQVRDDVDRDTFAPIDLLDYIYAVLHSPTYRETYKEFLKIDFPRVPYPDDPETFWKLVELGAELRQVHLLEHPVVNDFITTYPKAGSNKITNRLTKNDPGFVPDKPKQSQEIPDQVRDDKIVDSSSKQHSVIADSDPQSPSSEKAEITGKVQINDEQYFGNVPLKAWEFYIGGYQPAQKWLKDRRDRTLTMEEIQHYQKIIVALMETDRIMGEVDGVFEITDN